MEHGQGQPSPVPLNQEEQSIPQASPEDQTMPIGHREKLDAYFNATIAPNVEHGNVENIAIHPEHLASNGLLRAIRARRINRVSEKLTKLSTEDRVHRTIAKKHHMDGMHVTNAAEEEEKKQVAKDYYIHYRPVTRPEKRSAYRAGRRNRRNLRRGLVMRSIATAYGLNSPEDRPPMRQSNSELRRLDRAKKHHHELHEKREKSYQKLDDIAQGKRGGYLRRHKIARLQRHKERLVRKYNRKYS